MLLHRIVNAVAYILWLTSVVLYNLALWGPQPVSIDRVYVMRLWADGSPSVALDVGLFGVCTLIGAEGQPAADDSDTETEDGDTRGLPQDPTGDPTGDSTGDSTGDPSGLPENEPRPDGLTRRDQDQGNTTDTIEDLKLSLANATKYCVANIDFSLDIEDLYLTFVDEANMPRSFEANGTTSVTVRNLFRAASEYRTGSFPQGDPAAAMGLLLVAGFTLLFPIFFHHAKRRKICSLLLAISALLLGFGLMGAGGAFFSTWRLQTMVKRFDADGFLPEGVSRITDGDRLLAFLSAALGTNGAFVVLITLSAFARIVYSTTRSGPGLVSGGGGGKAGKFGKGGKGGSKVHAAEMGQFVGGLRPVKFKSKAKKRCC